MFNSIFSPKNHSPAFELLGLFLAVVLIITSVFLIVPFTDNPLNQTKYYLIFLVGLISLGGFLIKSLYQRKLELSSAPFLLPWFVFGLMYLVSTFLASPYPIESLLGMGGVMTGLMLLTITLSPLLTSHSANQISWTIGITGAGLGIMALAQAAGFGPSLVLQQISGLQIANTPGFSLTGSILVGIEVCLVAGVVGIVSLWQQNFKSKFWLITLPIVVVGLAIQVWILWSDKPAQLSLPDWKASWSIALDSMREPRSALFGHGPASYSNLYLLYRPAWVNGTNNWALQFGTANNWPLTIVPTLGLAGLVVWLWFVVGLVKAVGKNKLEPDVKPIVWGTLTLLGLLVLTPPNPVLLSLLAVFLAVWARHGKLSQHLIKLELQSADSNQNLLTRLLNRTQTNQPHFSPVSVGLATVVVLGLGFLIYLVGRTYVSQVYAYRATMAANSNDGVGVYNNNLASVQLNQYLDINRRRFALTNLLLAASLSNKTDATTEDRNQTATLLQQAIREARAAATLDPQDTQNWQVLAQIYQNMISTAPDAREWAVQAYVKAIETSPSDPNLRITLGGIFLANNQPQQAVPFFNQAVSLKPDLANAHFNLAVALNQAGDLQAAKTSYNNALNLLKPESDDYISVNKQLEELDKAIVTRQESTQSGKLLGGQSITSQNVTQSSQQVVNQASGLEVNTASISAKTPTPTTKP